MNNALKIEEIPWSQIVHWYDRATDYPKYFDAIKNGTLEEKERATNKIRDSITHQSGIIYATPIALPFIIDLSKTETNTTSLFEIILDILKAVNNQYQSFEFDKTLKRITIKELIGEDYIWPKFISNHEDEILWEEYPYEPQHWLQLSAEILLNNKKSIQQINLQDTSLNKLQAEIITEMEKLQHTIINTH